MKQSQFKEVKRSSITIAQYNPRKITDDNKKRLKKQIKEHGLVDAPIVNITTGNIVGGNTRISILDEIKKYPEKDYDIIVQCIEVDEETEKKINVQLNNKDSQGEYDKDLLGELVLEGISLYDMGYSELNIAEIQFELGIDDIFEEAKNMAETIRQPASEEHKKETQEKRKEYRESQEEKLQDGYGETSKHVNNTVMVVFKTNIDKEYFMQKIDKDKNEQYVTREDIEPAIKDGFLKK